MQSFAYRRYVRYKDAVDFIDKCPTNFRRTRGTDECYEWEDAVVIKLDVNDDGSPTLADYTRIFGTHCMDEDTLITGDDDNNVYIVFKNNKKVVTEDISAIIHVLSKLRFDIKCVLHKKVPPADVPDHIKINLNLIQNNVINNNVSNSNVINNSVINNIICNSVNNLNISSHGFSTASLSGITILQNYLEAHLSQGVICPLRQLSKHQEWKPKYRNMVETQTVAICKSCNQRWLKGCCPNYNRENRTKWVVAIRWKK